MRLDFFESSINKINSFPVRTRLLLFIAILLVISVVWWQYVVLFIQQSQLSFKEIQAEKKFQMNSLESQLGGLTEKAIQQKIENVKKSYNEKFIVLKKLSVQVDAFDSKVATQKTLSEEVLQPLLSGGSLKVIHWENEGRHPLFDVKGASQVVTEPGTIVSTPASYINNTSMLHQDMIVLKFEGGYFPFLAYLKRIEKLGWQLFFNGIDYEVVEYPVAIITLQVSIPNVDEV